MFGLGVGIALGATLIFGYLVNRYFNNRPRPWDTSAFTVVNTKLNAGVTFGEFMAARQEKREPNYHYELRYSIQNNTDWDLFIPEGQKLQLQTRDDNTLSPSQLGWVPTSTSFPAQRRTELRVDFKIGCPEQKRRSPRDCFKDTLEGVANIVMFLENERVQLSLPVPPATLIPK